MAGSAKAVSRVFVLQVATRQFATALVMKNYSENFEWELGARKQKRTRIILQHTYDCDERSHSTRTVLLVFSTILCKIQNKKKTAESAALDLM